MAVGGRQGVNAVGGGCHPQAKQKSRKRANE